MITDENLSFIYEAFKENIERNEITKETIDKLYMVVNRKIIEVATEEKKRLGGKFDINDFSERITEAIKSIEQELMEIKSQ